MENQRYTIKRTSKTLREILKGADCLERRQRVSELVEIYQPVWEATAKQALRRYGDENATLNASDIAGDEIAKMLSPEGDYFKTYGKERRLRVWIKGCIRHRAIDLLRQKGFAELPEDRSTPELLGIVDEREVYELFRKALAIADEICRVRNYPEDMTIFRAVRSSTWRLTPEERRKRGWSEWRERGAVGRIWDLIRDEAIPTAAAIVSDMPEESERIAQELWDRIKAHKTFDLPGVEVATDEQVD